MASSLEPASSSIEDSNEVLPNKLPMKPVIQNSQSCILQIFCDPIHGTIKMEGILLQIIDTPEFQRLRRIKQMGVNHYVYPGTVHTRFEHSIGVCYIAGEFIRKLQHDDVNEEITEILEEHELNVKIAALCHDLGHGPFSHVYDSFLEEVDDALEVTIFNKDLKAHEYRSGEIVVKIIDRLNKDDPDKKIDSDMIKQLIVFSEIGKSVMNECEIDEKDIESKILNKMKEKFSKCKMTEKNMFLFEIVANGFSGIDVDKMDYFTRDGHYIGLSKQFDWRRYIESTTVMEVRPGYHRLCSEDKVIHNLEELFHIRHSLHYTACYHKTVIIIEEKLKKIFKLGKDCVKFPGSDEYGTKMKYYGIADCWKNMEAFHHFDDTIVTLLKSTTVIDEGAHQGVQLNGSDIITDILSTDLSKAVRDVLERKNFPKFIDKCVNDSKDSSKAITREDFSQLPYVTVIKKKFTYGMNDKDPIRCHYFFNKQDKNPKRKSESEIKELGLLRPNAFSTSVSFIYIDEITEERRKEVTERIKELKQQKGLPSYKSETNN